MRFSDDTHHDRRTKEHDNDQKGKQSLYHWRNPTEYLPGTVPCLQRSVRTDFEHSMLGESAFLRAILRRKLEKRGVLPRVLCLEQLIAPLKPERGDLLGDKPQQKNDNR